MRRPRKSQIAEKKAMGMTQERMSWRSRFS